MCLMSKSFLSFGSVPFNMELSPIPLTPKSESCTIDKLPIEILGNEIFARCIPDSPYPDLGFVLALNSLNAPLLLCSVSQKWRAIAHSTPKLWSHITARIEDRGSRPLGRYIPPDEEDTANAEDAWVPTRVSPRLEALSLWLNRCGHHPLHFSFRDVDDLDDFRAEQPLRKQVFDLFVSRISQWQHISLDISPRYSFNTLCSIPECGAPQLRVAHIMIDGLDRESAETQADVCAALSRLLSFSRCINYLRWDGLQYRILRAIPVQWDSLVKLVFADADMSIDDMAHILLTAKNLTELRIKNLGSDLALFDSDISGIDITHDKLRYLDLTTGTDTQCGELFDKLKLPALERLYLNHATSGQIGANQDLPVAPLLMRSRCSLRALRLWCGSYSEDHLIRILQLSPALTELNIISQGADIVKDRVITMLTAKNPPRVYSDEDIVGTEIPSARTQDYLCPNLQSITLHGCVSASGGLFSQMVVSRHPEGQHLLSPHNRPTLLKSVGLQFRSTMKDIYEKDVEVLMGLQGSDLRVHVRHY